MPVLPPLSSVLLGLLGLVLLLRASVTLGRWVAHRSGKARRAASPAALPEGHRPPVGLGPISPSERALTAEAARGLRDLQLFLLDHGTAA